MDSELNEIGSALLVLGEKTLEARLLEDQIEGLRKELAEARQQVVENNTVSSAVTRNLILAAQQEPKQIDYDDDNFIFVSPDGVPIDEPQWDGDDSTLEHEGDHPSLLIPDIEIPDTVDDFLLLTAKSLGTAPTEKFYRSLYGPNHPKGPMKGKDVLAVKRAISRWNPEVFPWMNFDPHYNQRLADAVKVFQKKSGIKQTTGWYGPQTHTNLLKTKNSKKTGWAFDDTALLLYEAARNSQKNIPRIDIQQFCLATALHRSTIHYSKVRPMMNMNVGMDGPWTSITWDCSTHATISYKVGRVGDPNYPTGSSRQYDGWGYTGTQIQNGNFISVTQLRPGDLIFYGRTASGMPTHVAVYIGDGKVVSHGSESGPLVLEYNYRSLHSCKTYF